MAKHGNRSISSKSGSADVFQALGINIDLKPAQLGKVFDQTGIVFLFAITLETAGVLPKLQGVVIALRCNLGSLFSTRRSGFSVLSRLSTKSYPPLLWGVASGLRPKPVSRC